MTHARTQVVGTNEEGRGGHVRAGATLPTSDGVADLRHHGVLILRGNGTPAHRPHTRAGAHGAGVGGAAAQEAAGVLGHTRVAAASGPAAEVGFEARRLQARTMRAPLQH